MAVGLATEHEQQRQDLNGFSKSHVIGKAGSKAERREEIEPPHADLLRRE